MIRRWPALLGCGFAVAALSVGISFFFPLSYRADADILVISHSRFGTDPYTTEKAAERIGENLAHVVSTNDFYGKVIAEPGYTLDLTRFDGVSDRVKRARWKKTLQAGMVYNTGVLSVSAYSPMPDQAKAWAGAAATALVNHGGEYAGGDVSMKILNNPVVTQFPVRPNLLINAGIGFVLGAALSAAWVSRKSRLFGG